MSRSTVLALLSAASLLVVPTASAADLPTWKIRDCSHGHGYDAAARGLRTALKHHQPLTPKLGRRAWHEEAEPWTVVNLPALWEPDEELGELVDPMGREPGEALCPAA